MPEHGIIGWLIVGLVVGAVAKLLATGRDPGGWVATILVGIVGSVLAGWGVRTFSVGTKMAALRVASPQSSAL